jgi:hypothetical protein
MSWKLSRYHTGDLVEVRSKEEILATLDQYGRTNHMPFMPEMLQYCGQRFRVGAVAHKACDMVGTIGAARRLDVTVHLAGLRCDGSAHSGCQAECNLFWKDKWLKPVGDKTCDKSIPTTPNGLSKGCTETHLEVLTRQPLPAAGAEIRYACQATEMFNATQQLSWWDLRQYIFDVVTGNHSLARVLRASFLASLRWLLRRVPFGYRLFKSFHDHMHLWLTGRGSPSLNSQLPEGARTPTGTLDLKPGEYVRIRPQAEIEQTIDKRGNNRGLSFDPEEMAPYCDRVVKVQKRVTQIIEERTGRMLSMKEPCIMLEGVVCNAEYASCRLNCPRAIPSYWRELWLERIGDTPPPSTGHSKPETASP